MKILYLVSLEPTSHLGILNKIISQTSAWKNMGCTVKIFNIVINKKSDKLNIPNFKFYYRDNFIKGPKNLTKDIKNYEPDIIYLRFEKYKPFLEKIIRNWNTVLELNTDDISELKLSSKTNFQNKLILFYHLLTRSRMLKFAKGFVSVSSEILGLPYIKRYVKNQKVIPNSINLKKYRIVKKVHDEKVTNLLFIGNFDRSWQGIDKIIRLAKKTESKLFFHLVGLKNKNMPDLPNIKYYGYLSKEGYSNVASKCDIGIGTLALHRKNMNKASPLKVLEYLAFGLPVIIAYDETCFRDLDELPEWVLKIPNKENNIDKSLDDILKFSNDMKNYIVPHAESKKFIDSFEIEREKINFFRVLIEKEKLEIL